MNTQPVYSSPASEMFLFIVALTGVLKAWTLVHQLAGLS